MNQQSGEKSELPTPKKLRDARKKGEVAKSQEVGSTAVVIAVFAYIWGGWGFIEGQLMTMLEAPIQFMDSPFQEALANVTGVMATSFALLTVPLLVLVAVMGILGTTLQIGVLFSFEPVKPNLNKLNPQQWFKKVFALNNLLEFGKSLFKIIFLVLLLRWIILDSLDGLIKAPLAGVGGLIAALNDILFRVVAYTAAAYVAVAVVDYLLQRKLHTRKLMMTKDEVMREFKEMEGDPHIKSQRKQIHREMAMNDALSKTKKASVLVTNPTHIAVAIFYKRGETDLPLITAMGQDAIAHRMIEVAAEAGVPVMRNVPLARGLWEQGSEMEYIPSDLIEPVAEVLKWVEEITPAHMRSE